MSGRPNRHAAYGLFWLLALLMAGPQVFAQGGNRILGVRVSGSPEAPVVSVETSQRPDSSVFSLSDPLQVVVDIADASPQTQGLSASGLGAVRGVTVEEIQDPSGVVTRVSIGLSRVSEYTYDVSDSGVVVRLSGGGAAMGGDDPIGDTLGSLPSDTSSAPAGSSSGSITGGAVRVIGLEFLPYPNRSRVRIETSEPVRYTVSEEGSSQVVVNLPRVKVPKQYQWPLDTREFPSAVSNIAAYPASNGGNTKVVIKLRETTPYEVTSGGSHIYLDFDVPASLRGASSGQGMAMASGTTAIEINNTPSAGSSQGAYEGPAPSSSKAATMISGSGEIQSLGGSASPQKQSKVNLGIFGSQAYYSDPSGELDFSGRPFSVDLRETDIHNAFRLISSVSGVNIVISDDVAGTVTMRLVDVPWDQALAAILQAKGMGAVRFGNIIRISTNERLAKERELALDAQEASEKLEPLNLMVLPLNYAGVDEVEKQINAVLSDRGQLTVDTRTNSLIIEDTSANLARAQAMVKTLDTQTPEVLIEARIVEANTSYVKEFGIQWGGNLDFSAATGLPTGLYFPNAVQVGGGQIQSANQQIANLPSTIDQPNWVVDLPTANRGGALNLVLGSLSGVANLDARLTAVEVLGEGRVISSPRVTTIDNTEATVVQGTRIPYQTVSAGGTQVQFIEASLELVVTPHITSDRRVFMEISISNNRPDFGQAVQGQPAIEVKEATTEVMVPDGDTTVIGGVFTQDNSNSMTGLPGLQKLPVIGWMFRQTLEREDRKELLVFITPHILSKSATPAATTF